MSVCLSVPVISTIVKDKSLGYLFASSIMRSRVNIELFCLYFVPLIVLKFCIAIELY